MVVKQCIMVRNKLLYTARHHAIFSPPFYSVIEPSILLNFCSNLIIMCWHYKICNHTIPCGVQKQFHYPGAYFSVNGTCYPCHWTKPVDERGVRGGCLLHEEKYNYVRKPGGEV